MPLANTAIGWSFASSKISKSSLVRSVTSRPSGPTTVVKTDTICVLPRKTGDCWAPAGATASAATDARSARRLTIISSPPQGRPLLGLVGQIALARARRHPGPRGHDVQLVEPAVEDLRRKPQHVLPVQFVGHPREG